MIKKTICKVLSLTLGFSLLVGCSNNGGSSTQTVKIGVIGPLTGAASTYGQSVKNAVDLIQEEVNSSGGINGKNIEFIFEDDQADPNSAIQAFNKLVNNDKVVSILGAVTSGSTLAVAPMATNQKVPLITPTGTEPTITEKGGIYTFRGCFIDPFQGEILAKYSNENLKAKTAAVLYNNGSDYSKGIAESFKTDFEAAGGTVTEFLTYNDGDTDFNAQLTKIKGTNPDVLILPDYYDVVGTIARQVKDNGITSTLLGGDGWDSEELYNIGGDAVNGALYVNHYYSQDSDELVKSFVDSYTEKFGKEPDSFAALGYDTAKVLIKALENSTDYSPESIIEELAKTSLDSVTGHIEFDETRSAVKSATIIEVQGKDKVLVDKVTP